MFTDLWGGIKPMLDGCQRNRDNWQSLVAETQNGAFTNTHL